MKIDPKPCPFCGGDYAHEYYPGEGDHTMSCLKCRARMGSFATKKEAVAAWNARHEAAKVAEQPDDCRGAFEKWWHEQPSENIHIDSAIGTVAWDAWQAAWRPEREIGWLPIGTAPKDGSDILLSDGILVEKCKWSLLTNCWFSWEGGMFISDESAQKISYWTQVPKPPITHIEGGK